MYRIADVGENKKKDFIIGDERQISRRHIENKFTLSTLAFSLSTITQCISCSDLSLIFQLNAAIDASSMWGRLLHC